jgi:hypothetical protein
MPKKRLNQNKFIYHDVLAKETKYSIAKIWNYCWGIRKRNPEVVDNLPIGYRLIKGSSKSRKVVEK